MQSAKFKTSVAILFEGPFNICFEGLARSDEIGNRDTDYHEAELFLSFIVMPKF